MKARGLSLAKWAFSLLLIFFLYRATPLAQIAEIFRHIDYRYLPLIFIVLFSNTVLSALKWKILLQADAIAISLADLTASYLAGTFFNLFLPSNIGGDSYRIYDVARRSKQMARSAASVLADRLSGFLALIVLSLAASFPVAGRIGKPCFFFLPLTLLLVLVLGLWLLVHQNFLRRVLSFFHIAKIPRLQTFIEQFFMAWRRYHQRPRVVIQVLAISFTFQLCVIIAVYLMARALGANVSPVYFIAFVPVITLMEAIPISIYGLGIRDFGYVFFFGLAGMTEIQTRSLALLFLAVTVCYSLFGGLVFWGRHWREKR